MRSCTTSCRTWSAPRPTCRRSQEGRGSSRRAPRGAEEVPPPSARRLPGWPRRERTCSTTMTATARRGRRTKCRRRQSPEQRPPRVLVGHSRRRLLRLAMRFRRRMMGRQPRRRRRWRCPWHLRLLRWRRRRTFRGKKTTTASREAKRTHALPPVRRRLRHAGTRATTLASAHVSRHPHTSVAVCTQSAGVTPWGCCSPRSGRSSGRRRSGRSSSWVRRLSTRRRPKSFMLGWQRSTRERSV